MSDIGVVFVSDRGDAYLPACCESFYDKVDGAPVIGHVVDDREHQLGMAGAVREAWTWALDTGLDYLLHVEEDFLFTEPVRIDDLVWILDHVPHLAQVVLKRQPWSDEERAAGGIIELNPGDYVQCAGMRHSLRWVEHHRIFSLNPCLIPRRILELGWPDGNEAEFTQICIEAGYRFAFYGGIDDPPRIQHVGTFRGTGWKL
jgi:hypothetical protein